MRGGARWEGAGCEEDTQEGSAARLVRRPDVCAPGEEEPRHLEVAVHGGVVEGGPAILGTRGGRRGGGSKSAEAVDRVDSASSQEADGRRCWL